MQCRNPRRCFSSSERWIEAAYAVWLGDILPTDLIESGPFAGLLGGGACPSRLRAGSRGHPATVELLFDHRQRFRLQPGNRLSATNVQTLALGTILHVVQDAHSRSHTTLSSKDGRKLPEIYDARNRQDHCRFDQATNETKPDIDSAIGASAQMLRMAFGRRPWAEVAAFLESVGLSDVGE